MSNDPKHLHNLSEWVLFTDASTQPLTVKSFLSKVRTADRPFIRIYVYPRKKYRYCVECDLLEGLKVGNNIGFTELGITKVEQIMTCFPHKTQVLFRAGNCYVYARYLNLEDAICVANSLAALAEVGGMWDSRDNIPGYR
ncbi:hypothetical protein [Iningainema tapete]|uniref:Uncharacterized protein n=1 Tax=Iningainema tapete BLCC-T55 TaxID=2748662 RepID=A0A8J6XHU7_9CYAN|nr:hypothetical protein [Iningainema tapete]MBD2772541.1 hypothetical protein [Iningainema tapete BLCC-T55]